MRHVKISSNSQLGYDSGPVFVEFTAEVRFV